jgi:hypothetical protein
MSRLEALPPDQRATLSLLLGQRKTYAEVSALLSIDERTIHARAQSALAMLAPREARELAAERREDIGDYLLGQQERMADRLATRAYLGASEPARAWAGAIAQEIASLASSPLPEIPAASTESSAGAAEPPALSSPQPAGGAGAAPPTASGGERLPSSRVGGALLLAAIAAAVVIAVILITGGGGSHAAKTAARASQKKGTGPQVTQHLTLTSPQQGSKTVGVMDILAEGSRRAFFIDAENLPESKGFFYALWLYNSPTSRRPLSSSPPVGSTHKLQGGALLPSDAGNYHTILLTRETSRTPTQPGPIVLIGQFRLGA